MASRRGSGAVRDVSGLLLGAVKASNLGVLALAKLVRGESLDKAHRAVAARTFPQNLGCGRRWRRELGRTSKSVRQRGSSRHDAGWRVGRSNECGGIREAEHAGETGAETPRG